MDIAPINENRLCPLDEAPGLADSRGSRHGGPAQSRSGVLANSGLLALSDLRPVGALAELSRSVIDY